MEKERKGEASHPLKKSRACAFFLNEKEPQNGMKKKKEKKERKMSEKGTKMNENGRKNEFKKEGYGQRVPVQRTSTNIIHH